MVIATLFGTLILTNLLIALMTTEYENVQEKAKDEVIYNKAELTSDLSKRSRLMPPPFNILALVVTLIIDIINFFTALISPSYYNIYTYIDHQLFFNLQSFNIWQFEYDDWKDITGTTLKYKTRWNILQWYLIAWWYDWIKDKKEDKKEQNQSSYWRIHHKACYGCLIYDNGHNDNQIDTKLRTETYRGITMTEYLERYERKRKQKIEPKDKQLLKRLTPNTLFCEYCYRPFLRDDVKKELTTSYIALLDLVSAIMFVIFPVAWIPLIILFFILAVIDYIFGSFEQDSNDENQYYKYTDFDKEVFLHSLISIWI